MSDTNAVGRRALSWRDVDVPAPARAVLRGVGQVFFQEHALSGAFFLVGIALSSPTMALGALAGSAIGTATAYLLGFDRSELLAGIYGFNATLVGVASFFFFRPGPAAVGLMAAGCVAATLATRLMRRYVPFPTYTTPFILTTWALYFLGLALGVATAGPGGPVGTGNLTVAAFHGVGQVMFQGNVWTGRLFLIGIALSDWRHATWVLAGAVLGAVVASYHVAAGARALDPERLVERALTENIVLGLYGYNATLTAVALYLRRRSLIPPLLGILLSVPVTEAFPMLGLPALTAPFVLTTWLVLAAWRLEEALSGSRPPAPA